MARQIRADYRRVGVIMISGEAPEAEAIEVLDAYIRKPCRVPELLTHVRAPSIHMDR
jgi:DNA-binding response OmpR family regulator